MKGLICRLMHPVCQLCGNAMDILKAGSKQNQLPAISQKWQLQQSGKSSKPCTHTVVVASHAQTDTAHV